MSERIFFKNDNHNDNSINIIFTIKNTKLYVPVITISAKDNKKLSKFLSKRFKRSLYWNEYKTKKENKITNQNFVRVKRLAFFLYPNQGGSV